MEENEEEKGKGGEGRREGAGKRLERKGREEIMRQEG